MEEPWIGSSEHGQAERRRVGERQGTEFHGVVAVEARRILKSGERRGKGKIRIHQFKD